MFNSYNEDKIKALYKELRNNGDVKERLWANCCGNSTVRMIEAYDEYYTVHGVEAVDKIKQTLLEDKNKMYSKGSSCMIADMLLSGKYDDKLALTKNKECIHNVVLRQLINDGTLPTLMVVVSEEYERQAPVDHIKGFIPVNLSVVV